MNIYPGSILAFSGDMKRAFEYEMDEDLFFIIEKSPHDAHCMTTSGRTEKILIRYLERFYTAVHD